MTQTNLFSEADRVEREIHRRYLELMEPAETPQAQTAPTRVGMAPPFLTSVSQLETMTTEDNVNAPYRAPTNPDRKAAIVICIARQSIEKCPGSLAPHLAISLERIVHDSAMSEETREAAAALLDEVNA